jgi:hypothetical protein
VPGNIWEGGVKDGKIAVILLFSKGKSFSEELDAGITWVYLL